MLTFGLTFKAFDWFLEAGIYKLMYLSGSIQIVVLLLTVPMCSYNILVHYILS